MKDLSQTLFNEKLFEYLLLIPIDDSVSHKVKEIKHVFFTDFGCKNAPNQPHISLIDFMQYESSEFRITNCFEKFAQFVKPPNVELNGFGEFPKHTIYINIESAEPIRMIVREMRHRFNKLLRQNVAPRPVYVDRPHLTIARGMDEKQFQNAWQNWNDVSFEDSYVANEMLLIKREVDQQTLTPIGQYRPVKHFPFRGKKRNEQMDFDF